MLQFDQLLHRLRHTGALLLLGVLTFGLVGCYTQLKTVDTSDRRARTGQVQSKTQQYADEYRREYRRRTNKTAKREYNYHFYDRGMTYSRWHYDPFFHDPFFDDPFFHRPYGTRFSFSFHFGSPYFFSHRPYWRYHSGFYSGYGPGIFPSYGNHYYGGQNFYYGDVMPRASDRTRRPRGSTIGRGSSSGNRQAADRSVARSSHGAKSKARARAGRIGRSADTDRSIRTRRSARTERSRTSTRIGRSARSNNDRNRARRSSRSRTERSTRSRSSRDASRNRSARSRSNSRTENGSSESGTRSRSRNRSGSDEDENGRNLRSDARLSPSEGGRIGQRTGSVGNRVRLPDDVYTSIQETASSLKKDEIALRTRRLRKQWYGSQELSDRERAEFSTRLARTLSSAPDGDKLSRLRKLTKRNSQRAETKRFNRSNFHSGSRRSSSRSARSTRHRTSDRQHTSSARSSSSDRSAKSSRSTSRSSSNSNTERSRSRGGNDDGDNG